ncbi:MAG: phospho-N-acetylmuramoyl-pentapeptide-transferase [Bacteroides sp.]|nr:phospho-N-acetylmuramoyl-pentapeptide-transferase [Bacteroides sp.]MDE6038589.1 phospho-N-acetylmuramoyl-pentapeptide-transferase [Paramuribaculum sp.]MBD5297411.1 phospho-N-acetylmuramoyl-pentapeptide-transferase [Bacteroides sp.]MBD5321025.1 phospho-N-acetylmuramoyl-pentapeptide-transferase [Bacteroides sp.]MBD5349478.1 phospho-N-acetylmuramoyl-pentapeptide-transferase [Bacteroides sp.]
MLYYLFSELRETGFPGARLMDYITFRSGAAMFLALIIATVFGRRIIDRLQLMQVGEIVRDLGLQGQMEKTGTPTMGGVIIIISILIPCILIGNLSNVYMLLMIVATVWLGILGFLDDYLKIKRHNKDGMSGRFKIIGQVGLGLLVGLTMWLSPKIVMHENSVVEQINTPDAVEQVIISPDESIKAPQTTIPFVKNHNFDYTWLTGWMGDHAATGGWIAFILVTIFAVAGTSNGANLTDGLDGLCTGTSAIIGVALAIMAYLGGHIGYATYLNIMYIPDSAELVVFMSAFIGALIGFLWYNTYPAQVFMGDTGSLTIGGIIAVFAILIRKELLIPILCAIFFIEDLSVMIQMAYFKFTKKRTGTGVRIFKMTPLHHHFQIPGSKSQSLMRWPMQPIPESKIVTRFWIIGIMLAIVTFVTLKIR